MDPDIVPGGKEITDSFAPGVQLVKVKINGPALVQDHPVYKVQDQLHQVFPVFMLAEDQLYD